MAQIVGNRANKGVPFLASKQDLSKVKQFSQAFSMKLCKRIWSN